MQIQYIFLFYFRLKDTLQVVAVLVLHHRGGPARSHSQSLSALSEPWGRLGRGRRWPLSATVTEAEMTPIYIPTTLALKSWNHGMELIEMSVIVWEVRRVRGGRPGWPPPVCPVPDRVGFKFFF